jgi:hypothetical protein
MDVLVFLQTRIPALSNLKVAQMERGWFPRLADQGVAHDVSPGRARRRRRTLVHLRGNAVPGDAIEMPVPPTVLRGKVGKLTATVV